MLKNVSFSIKHGETIALVGHSGAGKTTITNLILKFYDPTSGSITINGTDYADVSHQDIRSNVALVFQDSELFSSTIRENVSYGKPNANDEEIEQALKKANAYDFIMKFPKTLNKCRYFSFISSSFANCSFSSCFTFKSLLKPSSSWAGDFSSLK